MSAMHHDTSPDLRVVGSKLKDILEVYDPLQLLVGKIQFSNLALPFSHNFLLPFVFFG